MDGKRTAEMSRGALDERLDQPRKQSPSATLGRPKMANSLNGFEPIRARPPVFLDADLSRMVSDLTRDVKGFDSLVHRTSDGAKAERQWREIRARAGIITTKVHAILDEITCLSQTADLA
jgi:hypothetical protein